MDIVALNCLVIFTGARLSEKKFQINGMAKMVEDGFSVFENILRAGLVKEFTKSVAYEAFLVKRKPTEEA